MAQIYNLADGAIIPQPDFTATQDEHGSWTASQSFWCKKGQIDNATLRAKFAFATPATTLDPDLDDYFSFLKLEKIPDLGTVIGGYTRIKCDYVGFFTSTSESGGSGATAETPTYSMRGVLKPAPIMAHPKWTDLSAASKARLNFVMEGKSRAHFNISEDGYGYMGDDEETFYPLETGPFWAVPTGDELEFARLIAQGILTYDVGTFEWTKRWGAASGLTSAQLNLLGKIATPPGSPPSPGTGRDWMMVGANQEQSGSGDLSFQNEIVFLLSDDGGHNSFLQS